MTVQLMPYGFIVLPRGYWAYMNTNWNDAWAGKIERFDGTSIIFFSGGLIQSPFEVFKKKIKWTKTSMTVDRQFVYSLVKTKKSKRVIANIDGVFFDSEIKDEAEIEGFLSIISRYREGRCESCFNSSWTKGMRKSLEKRFGEK